MEWRKGDFGKDDLEKGDLRGGGVRETVVSLVRWVCGYWWLLVEHGWLRSVSLRWRRTKNTKNIKGDKVGDLV